MGNAQNIENTRNDIQKLETKIIPQLELDYKIINDKFVQYENKKHKMKNWQLSCRPAARHRVKADAIYAKDSAEARGA